MAGAAVPSATAALGLDQLYSKAAGGNVSAAEALAGAKYIGLYFS